MALSPSVWIASIEDAEAVATLLIELRDWRRRPNPITDDLLGRRVAGLLRSEDAEFLLARSEGWTEPFGVCQLRFRPSVWAPGCDCQIEDLYVRSHARGRGVGRALVEAAINRGTGRGCARVDVDVAEGNQGAVHLYRRLGFTPKAPGGRQVVLRRELDPNRSGDQL